MALDDIIPFIYVISIYIYIYMYYRAGPGQDGAGRHPGQAAGPVRPARGGYVPLHYVYIYIYNII